MDAKEHMKQRMIEGKLYMGSGLPQSDLKQWMDRFNNAPREEAESRTAYLRNMFGSMGKDCYIEAPFYCDHGFNIYIGDNFYANTGLIILDQCPVHIGNNVFIGPRVGIYCATHPIDAMIRNLLVEGGKPITIGDNVWIGGGVNICPGVSIGNNTVIGAGAVVTKDIPSNVIAGGNPCKVIREITEADHDYWMEQLREFEEDTKQSLLNNDSDSVL